MPNPPTDTEERLEAERRHIAVLLESSIVDTLTLMLAQASVYEQTLGGGTQVRLSISVLASLARQALQQVRDLGANLNPTVLESLGLEAALESLASQEMRQRGVNVALRLPRTRERLPPLLELTLFRAVQDALWVAFTQCRANRAALTLEHRDTVLALTLFAGGEHPPSGAFASIQKRIIAQHGVFELLDVPGGWEMRLRFRLAPPVELTARELEVLALLVEGLSNKEIAAALSLSQRTVKFHLDNLYAKLGVSTRTEAAVIAVRQALVRPVRTDGA